MDELAGLSEEARKVAMERFRLFQPHFENNEGAGNRRRRELRSARCRDLHCLLLEEYTVADECL